MGMSVDFAVSQTMKEVIPLIRNTLETIAHTLEEKAERHEDSDVINRMERARIYREVVAVLRSCKP